MLVEVLIFVGVTLGLGIAVFVGVVALLLFTLAVYATADKILWLLGPKPWEPPKHQWEDDYKAQIERIRETMNYGPPVFKPKAGDE